MMNNPEAKRQPDTNTLLDFAISMARGEKPKLDRPVMTHWTRLNDINIPVVKLEPTKKPSIEVFE